MSDVVGDGDDNDGIDALEVLLPLWRSVPSQLDDGAENAKGLGATHQADDDPPVFSLVSSLALFTCVLEIKYSLLSLTLTMK